MTLKIRKLYDEMNDVILEERKALLKGDLLPLSDFADRKKRLLEELGSVGVSGNFDIGQLRKGLRRNHDLIEQALSGVASVKERMIEMRSSQSGLNTYDQTGQRQEIQSGKSSLEQRL